MLSRFKKFTPLALRRLSRKIKRFIAERKEARMTPRETFTRIYLEDLWDDGQKANFKANFYSGPGSGEEFSVPYAAYIRDFILKHDISSVVDLGCGDFRVGALIASPNIFYTGIDVVEPLIAEHKKRHAGDKIDFRCLDMVADELPDADLVLVRQVFQHLSNGEIATILRKLKKYKWAIITEDQAGAPGTFAPNIDKPHGAGSRIVHKSGVVLTAPPFNIDKVETVLDLPGEAITRKEFAPDARIVTFLIPGDALQSL